MKTILRDPEALTRRRWDLLVVGGGIHGLFAAYDAAQRGLSVALIEAADFGSGLSFNHQRTLHGGLRALQSGALLKTRQQVEERRMWARIAPHLIRPLPFLMGTYRRLGRSRALLRAGLAAHDFVGRHRNDGIPAELHLPKTRLESRATTRRLFPGIAERGLTGGAVWYDYQTIHPDRLTWLVAAAAERAGATLANYLPAVSPVLTQDGRVGGVLARDALDRREHAIEASVTLLAAGGGIGALLRSFGAGDGPPLIRAMNVLLDRPARDIALVAPGSSGRMLTAVPWRGAVLAGTHQSETFVTAPELAPPASAVEAFVTDIRVAFPAVEPDLRAVRLVHHGLTPAVGRDGRADLLPEPLITSHASRGRPGLISLIGVKYTTARQAAERAVDAACRELGRSRGRCATAHTVLPHADLADVEGRLIETQRELHVDLDSDVAAHLAGWYATEAPAVLRHAAAANAVDRLAPGQPILRGEVSYAVEQLGAMRLSDVVLRRTPLGSAGHPGRPALERAAAIMGGCLGWTAGRIEEEIGMVEDRYAAGLWPRAPGPRGS